MAWFIIGATLAGFALVISGIVWMQAIGTALLLAALASPAIRYHRTRPRPRSMSRTSGTET